MIYDLNNVANDPFEQKRYDVCICGGGVAGITLALQLSKKYNILLLEGGDLNFSVSSQEVFSAENIGQSYLDASASRQRFLGGASNHWGGWCRPLDSHDFVEKDYLKYSGWPIVKKDLDPYLAKAKAILDIPDDSAIESDGFSRKINESELYESFRFWFSAPTRFGYKYREDIQQAKNIDCFLNANITDIVLDGDRVNAITLQNYSKRVFNASVKGFVLAAGGIENARILLSCNKQIKQGLGNQNDLVGRFFTEHPHATVGGFILEDHVSMEGNHFFAPTHDLMKQQKILNFGLRVQNFDFRSDLRFADKVRNALCAEKNNLDLSDPQNHCLLDGMLRMASEQAPNFNSRITLAKEQDKFGMPRSQVDWHLSEIDLHSMKRGAMAFGQLMAQYKLGRVQIAPWLRDEKPTFPTISEDEVGGSHHMCTTRMAESPKHGVVDKNQKVFGIDNLYVAGSSVFSTSGHANPTFTIVQMTLRLADYLNRNIG